MRPDHVLKPRLMSSLHGGTSEYRLFAIYIYAYISASSQIFGRRTGVQVRRNKLRVTASHQWHDWLLRDGLSRAINEMDN